MATRTKTAAPKTEPAEALTGEIVGAELATRPHIEFRGRMMAVQQLDETQWAILIDAERWAGKAQREREALGEIADNAPADDPARVKLEQITKVSMGHLGRFMTVLGSLFLREDDWDFIREGMADRTITRAEIMDLPVLIIKACRDNDELRPDNRAARRSKAARAR